jgi:uncharacterized membrane protein
LNLPFETYKIKCKNLFLSWTVLLCVLWVYFILYVLSIIMLYMHWWRNNKSFKKQKKTILNWLKNKSKFTMYAKNIMRHK